MLRPRYGKFERTGNDPGVDSEKRDTLRLPRSLNRPLNRSLNNYGVRSIDALDILRQLLQHGMKLFEPSVNCRSDLELHPC